MEAKRIARTQAPIENEGLYVLGYIASIERQNQSFQKECHLHTSEVLSGSYGMLFSANHCPELKGLQNQTCRDYDGYIENKCQCKSAHVHGTVSERLSDPRVGIDCLH